MNLRLHDPDSLGPRRSTSPPATPRRQFLVAGAAALASQVPPGEPPAPPGLLFCTSDGLSPDMTLPQFFEEWFLPVVLVGQQEARPPTIGLYRNTLQWWTALTPNPPVQLITSQLLTDFKHRLAEATFKRGRTGLPTKLSRATIAKHLRMLRAIVVRLGPSSGRCETAGVLPRTPLVPRMSLKHSPKPCFTLQEARAIAAAAASFDRPRLADLPPSVFWRRRLGAWYYTGLRSGTVQLLHRSAAERKERLTLVVPDEAVTKTDKGLSLWLHPDLEALLDLEAPPDTPLFGPPVNHRSLIDWHQQLAAAAGLPPARQFSPHAWRRTHAEQMKLLGIEAVGEIVRVSLDHGDQKTSTTHYTPIVNELRLRLPTLWPREEAGETAALKVG